ncbi:MAG: hypothetical protein AVDCRST_MAG45-1058, partial [uncultured Solirubrobacterales bacterium]
GQDRRGTTGEVPHRGPRDGGAVRRAPRERGRHRGRRGDRKDLPRAPVADQGAQGAHPEAPAGPRQEPLEGRWPRRKGRRSGRRRSGPGVAGHPCDARRRGVRLREPGGRVVSDAPHPRGACRRHGDRLGGRADPRAGGGGGGAGRRDLRSRPRDHAGRAGRESSDAGHSARKALRSSAGGADEL